MSYGYGPHHSNHYDSYDTHSSTDYQTSNQGHLNDRTYSSHSSRSSNQGHLNDRTYSSHSSRSSNQGHLNNKTHLSHSSQTSNNQTQNPTFWQRTGDYLSGKDKQLLQDEIRKLKEELRTVKRNNEDKERAARQQHEQEICRINRENKASQLKLRDEHEDRLQEVQRTCDEKLRESKREKNKAESNLRLRLKQNENVEEEVEKLQRQILELKETENKLQLCLEKKEEQMREVQRQLKESENKFQLCLEQKENIESELEAMQAIETEDQTQKICEKIVEAKIKNSKKNEVLELKKTLANQSVHNFNSMDSQATERVTNEIIESFSEVHPDVQEVLQKMVLACVETITTTKKNQPSFQRSKLDERYFTEEDGSGTTLKIGVRTALALRYFQQCGQEDARVCVVFKSMVEHMKPVEGSLDHNQTLAVKNMGLF